MQGVEHFAVSPSERGKLYPFYIDDLCETTGKHEAAEQPHSARERRSVHFPLARFFLHASFFFFFLFVSARRPEQGRSNGPRELPRAREGKKKKKNTRPSAERTAVPVASLGREKFTFPLRAYFIDRQLCCLDCVGKRSHPAKRVRVCERPLTTSLLV